MVNEIRNVSDGYLYDSKMNEWLKGEAEDPVMIHNTLGNTLMSDAFRLRGKDGASEVNLPLISGQRGIIILLRYKSTQTVQDVKPSVRPQTAPAG